MAERRDGFGVPGGVIGLILASLAGASVLVLGTLVQMPGEPVSLFLAAISIAMIAFYAFVFGVVLGLPLIMLLRASGSYTLVSASIAGAVVAASALLVLNMMSEEPSPTETLAPVGTFVLLCVSGVVAGAIFFVVQRGIAGGIKG